MLARYVSLVHDRSWRIVLKKSASCLSGYAQRGGISRLMFWAVSRSQFAELDIRYPRFDALTKPFDAASTVRS